MEHANAPYRSGITLSEALNLLTIDQLQELIVLFPDDKTRPTRKADLVAMIERHLAGERLKEIWGRLDEIQQSAVSETLYGADGRFDARQFRAKYRAMPGFEVASSRRNRRSRPSYLCLFLYREHRYANQGVMIPDDLQDCLLDFVPSPAAPALPALDELPETARQVRTTREPAGRRNDGGYPAVSDESTRQTTARSSRTEPDTGHQAVLVQRDTERAAQQDLLTVLRLIDRGKVAVSAKTLQASAAAVQSIAAVLCDGDFFDPAPKKKYSWELTVGAVRAFAWPWLVQAAKLAEPRGAKLALTKAGRAALSAPPPVTLRRIWQRWIKNTMLDEFSRIEAIKGQRGKGRRSMTSAAGRRPIIAEALEQCPVGLWVRFDDLSRFMRASRLDFDVARDSWRLYIADAHYGSLGYEGYDGWHILQERYLLCFLFEYAATLGLLDVVYTEPHGARTDYTDQWGTDELKFLSRYDGLRYFRLNSLGAFCLGLAETYEPGAPQPQGSLTVFPNLRVEVTGAPLLPDEALLLQTYATAESETAWRLDRGRILSAIESGHRMGELREFLASRDDQPLPEMVEGLLRDTERRARALVPRGMALLIECSDAELVALFATHERTGRLCLRAGERHLVVKAGSEDAFRKAIHELGYGMPRA